MRSSLRAGRLASVALADDFERVVASLPPDWTQLELDLRLADEDRYIDAATLLTQINAMPYSEHDWHFRLRAANRFGHARRRTRQWRARWRCSTTRASTASWWPARRAPAGSRSPAVGPARVGPPGAARAAGPSSRARGGPRRPALPGPVVRIQGRGRPGGRRSHRQPLRRRGRGAHRRLVPRPAGGGSDHGRASTARRW